MNKPFIEVFDDCTKYAKKIQTSDFLRKGKYAIIDQSQEYISGYANNEEGLYDKYPVIIFGDHTRIIKYIDFPFFLGADGTKILQPKIHESDCKYLFYFLLNAKIPNTGYNRHYKWLKELDVPIPPLDEQKKIADKLDKITVLIAKRKFQLEKLDLLVKSRFIEMFGDSRQRVELTSVAKITGGLTKNPKRKSMPLQLPYLRVANVFFDKIDTQEILKIGLTEDERSKTILEYGDLLFVEGNGSPEQIGRVAIWRNEIIPCVHQNHLIKARLDTTRILPCYAMHCFMTQKGREQIKEKAVSTSGLYTLSVSKIAKLEIPFAPLALQTQFSTFVHQVDKSKFEIQKGLEKLETLKKALMQQYFG